MQNKSMSSDTDRSRPSLKRKHEEDSVRNVSEGTDCLTVRSKKIRVLQEDEQTNRNQSNQSSQESTNGKVQERQDPVERERSNESN